MRRGRKAASVVCRVAGVPVFPYFLVFALRYRHGPNQICLVRGLRTDFHPTVRWDSRLFTAICVSIDRSLQGTAPIFCLPFDRIGGLSKRK